MDELKIIKKKYGENMMHLCRKLFPTILNEEGRLISILDSTFGYAKYLYDDIINKSAVDSFKDFIYYLYDGDKKRVSSNKTPFELMSDAGYELYECWNTEDIMRFKKYYSKNEELCTFDSDRIKKCQVFFAVKKNVDKITREKFHNPKREDEYGTSVISIQFTRGKLNTLSIKNRYNHTVDNPDATFNNNLDNIIPGLTDSFEKFYDLNINQVDYSSFDLGYVLANDSKYYKYNLEINGIYYCPDNIIIDHGDVIKDYIDKEKYILIDQFIVNLQNKDKSIREYSKYDDSFCDDLNNIDKINIKKNNNGDRTLELIIKGLKPIYIKIDKFNNIIGYINTNLTVIKDNFLKYNRSLKMINIDNVIKIGNSFLENDRCIKHVNLKNVIEIGDCFLRFGLSLESINLDSVIKIGDSFAEYGYLLKYINAPVLKRVGAYFCKNNHEIKILVLPSVEEVGNYFFCHNSGLEYISMDNLVKAGACFLEYNINIRKASFNKLIALKKGFMRFNKALESISLDSVINIESNCLEYTKIKELVLNNVIYIGHSFLRNNMTLESFIANNVREISYDVLKFNTNIRKIILPNLEKIHRDFYDKIEIKEKEDSNFKCKIKKKD